MTTLMMKMTDDPIDAGLVQIRGQEEGYIRNFGFVFTVHREKGEQIIAQQSALADVIRERDEARAMVAELAAEVQKLLAPMNELLTHADGPEADRVFPQYEFDALRALLAKAEAVHA